jgi:hypothetical protein
VNVVERRTAVTRPEQEYDREFEYETKRYGGVQSYHDDDQIGYPSDNIHTGSDRGYHGDVVGSIRGRNSPSPRKVGKSFIMTIVILISEKYDLVYFLCSWTNIKRTI